MAALWRHGGLMVGALNLGSSDLSSSPGWGHCVVFLLKTLSHTPLGAMLNRITQPDLY